MIEHHDNPFLLALGFVIVVAAVWAGIVVLWMVVGG